MVFETDMKPFFMQLISWEDFVLFSSTFMFFQHAHDPTFLETTQIPKSEKKYKQANPIYFEFFTLGEIIINKTFRMSLCTLHIWLDIKLFLFVSYASYCALILIYSISVNHNFYMYIWQY
jgi:hypothetical protein